MSKCWSREVLPSKFELVLRQCYPFLAKPSTNLGFFVQYFGRHLRGIHPPCGGFGAALGGLVSTPSPRGASKSTCSSVMSLWSNPIPPVPSLRERYPLSSVSLPSISATILWSAVLAVASVFLLAPIMDKIVFRLINTIIPSFVPPKGELKTERQAIERLAYQTAAIAGSLLILWPILITSFISLVEGFAWVMGRESPRWIPYILFFAEMFMGNSLVSYYKDVPKVLLQFDRLRDDDLLQSAEQFYMGPDGERYEITTLGTLTKLIRLLGVVPQSRFRIRPL